MSTATPEDGPRRPLIRVHDRFDEEFPDASPRATECFLNLGRVATSTLLELGRLLERFGVPSYTGFNALTVMAGADAPIPPSVVAQRMVVTRPTVTGILHTLEGHGYVTRTAHGLDGRMQLVALTDRGRDLVRRVLPEVHRFENGLFGVLDRKQQEALLDILAALSQRLETLTTDTES